MGVTLSFKLMSNVQLQRYIRLQAKNSRYIFITDHARDRMLQRNVSDYEVVQCLREGIVQRPPAVDKDTDDLKCRMDYFGSARNLSVIVALDDDQPELIVITVMKQTR